MEYRESLEFQKTKPGKRTVQEMLSLIGFGAFHYHLLFLCGCGWVADNMWMAAYSLIMPQIKAHWGISDTTTGLIGSFEFAGMALGATFWGWMSDRVGRRISFTVTLGICGVFGATAAASVNWPMLAAMIFGLGFGVGGNLPIDGAMFAEFMPKENRGAWLVVLSVFWSIGSLYAASIAWALAAANVAHAWRYLLLILGGTNILMCVTRIGMPESPTYLVSKGKLAEAKAVIVRVAKRNGVELPEFELSDKPTTEEPLLTDAEAGKDNEPLVAGRDEGCMALCNTSRKMTITTVLLLIIWALTNFGYTGFNLFVPTLLKAKHVGGASNVYRDSLIYAAAGVPGTIVGAFAVETCLGRKWTMVGGTAIAAAALYLFTVANSQTTVVLVTSITNLFSMIMFAAVYTYTPEVFPTALRTTGSGLCAAASRVAGIVAPLFMGWLYSHTSAAVPMIVCTVILALGVVSMVCLPIETRGKELA